MTSLYLASGSPRRRELLTQIGVPFSTVSAGIDETPLAHESPAAYVERLACEKARAGREHLRTSVPDAAFCVLIDGVQHNLRASRRSGGERLDLSVGPIAITIDAPLETPEHREGQARLRCR